MADLVNDHFKQFYPPAEKLETAEREHRWPGVRIRVKGYDTIFPKMECADGWSVSVQGHWGAYSSPRDDFADLYTKVELGYPSAHEPLLDKYQDGDGDPTDTVYGYVPVDLVVQIIEKHGGLAKPAS